MLRVFGLKSYLLSFGLIVEATVPTKVSLPSLRQLDPKIEACTIEYLDLFEKVYKKASLRTTSY